MAEILVHLLLLAVGLAISPGPLMLCVLLLCTPKPLANASAFLVGYSTVPIGLIGAMLTVFHQKLVVGNASAPSGSNLNLVISVVFFVCALQQGFIKPQSNLLPRWMQLLDKITPPLAYAIGFVAMATNLKNLSILVSGLNELSQAHLNLGTQLVGTAILLLGTLSGMLIMLTLYILRPQRAKILLHRIRYWLERHTSIVLCALFSLLCLMFFSKGVPALLR